jgi:kynurenine 3-monooxygenase
LKQKKGTQSVEYLNWLVFVLWWCRRESNPRHKDFQSFALPTELLHHLPIWDCKSRIIFLFAKQEQNDFLLNHFLYFCKMVPNKHILTIGAGPVGLSISMLLQEKGYKISIFEKRSDPRKSTDHGRSINLALSDRGFRTLSLLGLEEKIKSDYSVAMKGRMIHDEAGNTHLQPYSSEEKCIYSVSRSLLNNILLDEAEKRGIEIQFEQKCLNYDPISEIIQFENQAISTTKLHVLATDGAFSPLRNALKSQANFQHIETKLDYSYKEFTIPEGKNNTWQMEKHALHIWPRKSFMLIALPNIDGSFTCTLFLQSSMVSGKSLVESEEPSFENISNPIIARAFFQEHFTDALALMPNFEDNFLNNPTSALFMETCSPWNLDDKLLLLGDAAHAIVPFYGQGLNAGLEDVRILAEMFECQNSFEQFQQNRKPDCDAIGELALQNFIEMRDLVTDDLFLKKRALESKLKKIYENKWTTQYELVTFSQIAYSKAQKLGFENNKKLEIILENEQLTYNLLNDKVTEQDLYLLSIIAL